MWQNKAGTQKIFLVAGGVVPPRYCSYYTMKGMDRQYLVQNSGGNTIFCFPKAKKQEAPAHVWEETGQKPAIFLKKNTPAPRGTGVLCHKN